jgi:hypothetical protein
MNRRDRKERRGKTWTQADSVRTALESPLVRGGSKLLGVRLYTSSELVKVEVADLVNPRSAFFCGVVVGHWVCGPLLTSGRAKGTYPLVSHCGAVATFEPWKIESGKLPATCYFCDTANHAKPVTRRLEGRDLEQIRDFWEVGMGQAFMPTAKFDNFEEKNNIRGKEAYDEWEDLGRTALAHICDQGGFNRHFGWKVFVQDVKVRPGKAEKRGRCRVKATHLNTRHMEIMIQPHKSKHEFHIDLACGRTDTPFAQVASAIQKSVTSLYGTREEQELAEKEDEVKGTQGTQPVAAAANGQPAAGVVDIEKLSKLIGSLEKVKQVGRDLNETAALKLAAQKKFDEANARAKESYVTLCNRQRDAEELAAMLVAKRDAAARLEMQLKNVRVDIEELDSKHGQATILAAAARGEYDPLENAAQKAKDEINELERMEAEALKAVGDAKALLPLLEALSKVS